MRFRSALIPLLAVVTAAASGFVMPSAASAAPTVTVSASRSAPGARTGELDRPTRARGARWLSAGRPVGTTLTTRFSTSTLVDGMRLQGAGVSRRIEGARLLFSDGSSLVLQTTTDGSRSLAFPARRVRWVRLVVEHVDRGTKQVGLAGWWFHRGGSGRGARLRGDAVVRATGRSASSGRYTREGWTATRRSGHQWMQASWKHPLELSAVRLQGGTVASVRTGYLQFSDGSRIVVGSLESASGAPTTIAFTPRMTKAVRFVVTGTIGGGPASVRRLSAWTAGTLPPQPRVSAVGFRSVVPSARTCSHVSGSASAQLVLLCPSNGSRTGRTAHLVISGPARARVRVVAHTPDTATGVRRVASAAFSSGGVARLSIPMRLLAHGPTAVRITATGVATPLYVQMENSIGVVEPVPVSKFAHGMDLELNEQFDAPISLTRTGAGAQYASGKPNSYGVDDFGDAIFAQPSATEHNIGTGGGYLRIQSRALRAGEVDPAGYGRKYVGGLISSAHMGGSGFSAQYGYFEVRMLGPAGAGTWPAFWLLSTGSLTTPGAGTGEIDVTELYGHDAAGACQTTHSWRERGSTGRAFCGSLANEGDFAVAWHTYGARITPTGTTFLIDGRVTQRTSAVLQADQPFFFLANLALGGGWPIGLGGSASHVTLFVDRISVWV